jgi:ADP-ribose pyrophosphatase
METKATADVVFTGRIFNVVKKYITGKSGERLERHVVVHPGAVVILPILSDGRIVLIRQHRVAVDEVLVELPAGTMEAGEAPIVTARRELLEETGYSASEIMPMLNFYASPGFAKEEMHLFKATGLVAGPTALEDDEKIETFPVDMPQAMKMILAGDIRDAKTIIGILWYHNRELGVKS